MGADTLHFLGSFKLKLTPLFRLVAKSPCAKGRFLGFGLCRWRGRFAAFPANE
jgi:hypothetical protein